ncbi:MAG: hypothetical protein EOO43_23925, partial [Flavobacterium sp.]
MGNFSFKKDGTRSVDVVFDDDAIIELKELCRNSIANINAYPKDRFIGKGIVMCAGGIEYVTCAYVCIKALRTLGCVLPIEVWHRADEMCCDSIKMIESAGASCRSFSSEIESKFNSVALKPAAIVESSFEEVLF